MSLHNRVRSTRPLTLAAALAATLVPATSADPAVVPAPNAVVIIGDRRVECDPPPLLADNDVCIPADLIAEQLAGAVSYKPDGDTWLVRLVGRELLLRAGRREFERDGVRQRAPLAPILREYTLYIPLWTVSYAFELGASAVSMNGRLTVTIEQPSAVVRELRYHDHLDKFRVVIDLTAPTQFRPEQSGRILKVTLPKPPPGVAPRHRLLTIENDLVKGIMQRPTPEGTTQVAVELAQDVEPTVFTLPDPPRIVIDIPRPGVVAPTGAAGKPPISEVTAPETHAAPDCIRWETRKFSTPRGIVRVDVMRIDLMDPRVDVRPALAGPTIMMKATASEIAARHGAVAAVNGGYFAARGDPLGMLVIDGEWIKAPILQRTVLGITARKELLMENLEFDGSVEMSETGRFSLDGLNCNHRRVDEIVLYTRRWGGRLPRDRHVVRAAIDANNVITSVNTRGTEFRIPAGGYALSATGGKARRLAKARVGETVTITLATKPRWDGVVHALGGGPRLVKNGKVCITAVEERFRRDVWATSAPRTAVGIDKQGRLVLVSVGAWPGKRHGGMRLAELAVTMLKLGCVNAMNLDGGSSSTFVVNGRVVNVPGSRWQRKVSNALLVLASSASQPRLSGS